MPGLLALIRKVFDVSQLMGNYSGCEGARYVLHNAVRVDGISQAAELRWQKYSLHSRYRWLSFLKQNNPRSSKAEIQALQKELDTEAHILATNDSSVLPPSTTLTQLELFR